MEPSSARISAGCIAPASTLGETSSCCNPGRLADTSPMTGTSVSHRTLNSVPAISATRVAGKNFENLAGQATITTSVVAATASAA